MPDWTGWKDANGGTMFVADGVKSPVLVHVNDVGEEERVLASFQTVEDGVMFQEWLLEAFAQTAAANKKLTDHVRTLYKASPDG